MASGRVFCATLRVAAESGVVCNPAPVATVVSGRLSAQPGWDARPGVWRLATGGLLPRQATVCDCRVRRHVLRRATGGDSPCDS
jgi:hypothetical protein